MLWICHICVDGEVRRSLCWVWEGSGCPALSWWPGSCPTHSLLQRAYIDWRSSSFCLHLAFRNCRIHSGTPINHDLYIRTACWNTYRCCLVVPNSAVWNELHAGTPDQQNWTIPATAIGLRGYIKQWRRVQLLEVWNTPSGDYKEHVALCNSNLLYSPIVTLVPPSSLHLPSMTSVVRPGWAVRKGRLESTNPREASVASAWLWHEFLSFHYVGHPLSPMADLV